MSTLSAANIQSQSTTSVNQIVAAPDGTWQTPDFAFYNMIKDLMKSNAPKFNNMDETLLSILQQSLSSAPSADLLYNFGVLDELVLGADSSKVSAIMGYDSLSFPGGDAILPGGFDQLSQYLYATPGKPILPVTLDVPVTSITDDPFNSECIVKVAHKDGTFCADKVVVTVPLGVLQAGSIAFNPALPSDKRAALRNIGAGVVNKVYLLFDKQFWPNDVQYFGQQPTGDISSRGLFRYFLNTAYASKQPTLLAFAFGSAGSAMEALTDESIKIIIVSNLKALFPAASINIVKFYATRWQKDPFAMMSQSFAAFGMYISYTYF